MATSFNNLLNSISTQINEYVSTLNPEWQHIFSGLSEFLVGIILLIIVLGLIFFVVSFIGETYKNPKRKPHKTMFHNYGHSSFKYNDDE